MIIMADNNNNNNDNSCGHRCGQHIVDIWCHLRSTNFEPSVYKILGFI